MSWFCRIHTEMYIEYKLKYFRDGPTARQTDTKADKQIMNVKAGKLAKLYIL